MPIPRTVARFNKVALNRAMRHVAPHLPGLGVVVHSGRRSGRQYRTPVNVFVSADTVRIALTYGSRSEWVRNVRAAGRCQVITRGHAIDLTAPRVVRDPSRQGVRALERRVLALLDVEEFLVLDRR